MCCFLDFDLSFSAFHKDSTSPKSGIKKKSKLQISATQNVEEQSKSDFPKTISEPQPCTLNQTQTLPVIMRATKKIQDKMLEITSKQDALRNTKRQQSVPLFAANSIHMSKEAVRKFTPALMNLFAYFISKSNLPVLLQNLQVKINKGRRKFI